MNKRRHYSLYTTGGLQYHFLHMHKENPFGLSGCSLPNGGLCGACCRQLDVIGLNKPRDTDCRYWTREDGCTVHGTYAQPEECKNFHCAGSSPNMMWGFINTSEIQETVTAAEATDARAHWLPMMA